MRKIRLLVGAGLFVLAPAASLDAQGTAWTGQSVTSYNVDVAPSPDSPALFRLFFDLIHEFRQERDDPTGNHYNFALAAEGFQDLDQDTGGPDHMALDARLVGRNYSTEQANPLDAEQRLRYLELTERAPSTLTESERAEIQSLQNRVLGGRKYFSYNLYYRMETDQDVSRKQQSAGASIAMEVPGLHGLLDALFAGTRKRLTGFTPQPVRLLLAGDYVLARDLLADVADPKEQFPRIRAQAAWSTLILDGLVLRASWSAEYLLDPPADIEAVTDDFNSFVQLWTEIPVNDQLSVMVKYIDGRLPPLYGTESAAEVGFSLSLQ